MAAPAFQVVNNSNVGEFAAAVTPNDSTTFTVPTRGLYVGAGGTLVVRMSSDQTNATFVGVQAGTILPVRVDRVLSTGTTAASIVALW